MADCKCGEHLENIRQIYGEQADNVEKALHEDGSYWARMFKEKVLEGVEDYFASHEFPECDCQDFKSVEQSRALMQEYSAMKKIQSHIAKRRIKDEAFDLLEIRLAGEDISGGITNYSTSFSVFSLGRKGNKELDLRW